MGVPSGVAVMFRRLESHPGIHLMTSLHRAGLALAHQEVARRLRSRWNQNALYRPLRDSPWFLVAGHKLKRERLEVLETGLQTMRGYVSSRRRSSGC
jgi:hypothetical protein